MRCVVHSIALMVAVASIAACGGGDSAAPVVPASPTTPTTPANPAPAPPIVAIFDRLSPSTFNGTSRYVLYKDSTFALQYVRNGSPVYSYPGRFTRADSVVRFSFTQAMAPSPWEADAILRRDVLVVQYNDIMLLTDFEDGDYMMEPM